MLVIYSKPHHCIQFQLSSSRPYVRKRCVLLLYKIFLKYPDSLRPTFPRLKEKLEDPDPGNLFFLVYLAIHCLKRKTLFLAL